MDPAWTLTVDRQWIAWLTFNLPGETVNLFNERTLRELEEHLDDLAGDASIKALVITSGKDESFIAGADIDELARITDADDARAKSRVGHAVFDRLAELPVPTVAAIHGTCLGGGLELALACDYRLVTDDRKTSLGLPEVGLGIIPGWGGTQRLPALVGLAAALTMILTGKAVSGRKAYRMGLADGIVAHRFLDHQVTAFVDRVLGRTGRRAVLTRRRRARGRLIQAVAATWPGRRLICRRAARQVMARTHGNYPAPLTALKVVRKTYRRRNLARGLALEAEAFASLAGTPASRNLVRLFQASQRLRKADHGRTTKKLPPVERVGVVGAGVMGGGIAWACSRRGLSVRLKDIEWDAVARGLAAAASMYRPLVKRRRMTEGQVNLAMHRISPALTYEGFGRLDAVIEAVVEDLQIKRHVLAEIEAQVGPDTLICTNTSSLPLHDMAGALENPRRFIGLHFFNPVSRMPLVEVVPVRRTTRRVVLAAVDLVRRMGKTPIVVGDCPGFLVNRILLPYLVESSWMFEQGVEARRIDKLLVRFGMPMGPLALADEVGLDVGYKVAKVLENAYGPRMHVAGVLGDIVETGALTGRKGGLGFYRYDNGHRKPNPELAEIAAQARDRDGVDTAELSDEEILDRAVLIMVNEAARCLEEGIVDDPEALDMALVMGTGFAPFRGGLLRYADQRGVETICRRLEELRDTYGDRFAPAPLLERIAGNGGSFYRHMAAVGAN